MRRAQTCQHLVGRPGRVRGLGQVCACHQLVLVASAGLAYSRRTRAPLRIPSTTCSRKTRVLSETTGGSRGSRQQGGLSARRRPIDSEGGKSFGDLSVGIAGSVVLIDVCYPDIPVGGIDGEHPKVPKQMPTAHREVASVTSLQFVDAFCAAFVLEFVLEFRVSAKFLRRKQGMEICRR